MPVAKYNNKPLKRGTKEIYVAPPPPPVDATVTVDRAGASFAATYDIGLQHTTKIIYPSTGTSHATAKTTAETTLANGARYHAVNVAEFFDSGSAAGGLIWTASAWGTPNSSDPTTWNWTKLDEQLGVIKRIQTVNPDVEPVIIFFGMPWWTRVRLNSDGTSTKMTSAAGAGGYGDANSRVANSQLANATWFCRQIFKRYCKAANNPHGIVVKIYILWNELKGYFNSASIMQKRGLDGIVDGGDGTHTGKEDWENSLDPGYNNATYLASEAHDVGRHGYAYFYNKVRASLVVEAGLQGVSFGLGSSNMKLGGPYNRMYETGVAKNYSVPATGHPMSIATNTSGYIDDRMLQAMEYFHANCTSEMLVLDAFPRNNDGIELVGAHEHTRKYYHIGNWLNGLSTTKLKIIAEAYAWPYDGRSAMTSTLINAISEAEFASVKIASHINAALGMLTTALTWSSEGRSEFDVNGVPFWNAAPMTDVSVSSGGQPTVWGEYMALFQAHGSKEAGATVYTDFSTTNNNVGVFPVEDGVFIYNKTGTPLDVRVQIEGGAYEDRALGAWGLEWVEI